MAQPSSTHDRAHRSSSSSHHHHHRTISSTTLLLALSLILAVLAITLSIPSYNSGATQTEPANGILSYLTPRRAHGLVAREAAVAIREAEIARREAEFFAGAAAGAANAVAAPSACVPVIATVTQTVTVELYPTGHFVKEVVKEVESIAPPPSQAPPPWWRDERLETLLEREKRLSDREREVGSREQTVGSRELDAAKRETWIMDQLINVGNDKFVEEEVVYERKKPKVAPSRY